MHFLPPTRLGRLQRRRAGLRDQPADQCGPLQWMRQTVSRAQLVHGWQGEMAIVGQRAWQRYPKQQTQSESQLSHVTTARIHSCTASAAPATAQCGCMPTFHQDGSSCVANTCLSGPTAVPHCAACDGTTPTVCATCAGGFHRAGPACAADDCMSGPTAIYGCTACDGNTPTACTACDATKHVALVSGKVGMAE